MKSVFRFGFGLAILTFALSACGSGGDQRAAVRAQAVEGASATLSDADPNSTTQSNEVDGVRASSRVEIDGVQIDGVQIDGVGADSRVEVDGVRVEGSEIDGVDIGTVDIEGFGGGNVDDAAEDTALIIALSAYGIQPFSAEFDCFVANKELFLNGNDGDAAYVFAKCAPDQLVALSADEPIDGLTNEESECVWLQLMQNLASLSEEKARAAFAALAEGDVTPTVVDSIINAANSCGIATEGLVEELTG